MWKKKHCELYRLVQNYLQIRCLYTFLAGFLIGAAFEAASTSFVPQILRTGIGTGAAFMVAAGYIGGMFRILKSNI